MLALLSTLTTILSIVWTAVKISFCTILLLLLICAIVSLLKEVFEDFI